MIALFSVLKPFDFHDGLAGIIQRNAVESWMRILPKENILIVGNDAEHYLIQQGLSYVPVERNENNVPMLRDVWKHGCSFAGDRIRMYVNGDIILCDDLIPTVRNVSNEYKEFLIVGRRIDVHIDRHLEPDFDIMGFVRENGELHGKYGADYFIWRGNFYDEIPDFILGRMKWDNWLIWRAINLDVPVFDATDAITVIHQEHPRDIMQKEEERHNTRIAGKNWVGIHKATHKL